MEATEALSLKASESFDAVMRLYTPTVYGIAYARLRSAPDAEDVTQNVFVRYFRTDMTYESEEHRKAWLIRCAVNCANNCAKSAHFRRRSETVSLDVLAENAAPPAGLAEDPAESSELRSAVLDAVTRLPPKYRAVVHLFYFEDMPIARISAVLGARESTVRSQLSRARDKLRELLKGEVEL